MLAAHHHRPTLPSCTHSSNSSHPNLIRHRPPLSPPCKPATLRRLDCSTPPATASANLANLCLRQRGQLPLQPAPTVVKPHLRHQPHSSYPISSPCYGFFYLTDRLNLACPLDGCSIRASSFTLIWPAFPESTCSAEGVEGTGSKKTKCLGSRSRVLRPRRPYPPFRTRPRMARTTAASLVVGKDLPLPA